MRNLYWSLGWSNQLFPAFTAWLTEAVIWLAQMTEYSLKTWGLVYYLVHVIQCISFHIRQCEIVNGGIWQTIQDCLRLRIWWSQYNLRFKCSLRSKCIREQNKILRLHQLSHDTARNMKKWALHPFSIGYLSVPKSWKRKVKVKRVVSSRCN